MAKRTISIILALALALGLLALPYAAPGLAGAAPGSAAAASAPAGGGGGGAIDKVVEALRSAGPIQDRLKAFVTDEIEGFDDDEGEYDPAEAEAALKEISGFGEQLRALLAGLQGLPDDPGSGEGKTVRATREYLTMLLNVSADLSDVIKYGIAITEALGYMETMDEDVESYEEFSNMVKEATGATKEALEKIKPPSYMAISHNDMIQRITEFRDFAEDFYNATDLEDPLRIYSCIYRMDRISRMFDICADNLNADLLLQLHQAERRLSGPIDVLQSELTRYLALLNR